MIRKFNEYFNTSLKDVISYEDVEDQLLRLKEVFDCDIIIEYEAPVRHIPIGYQALCVWNINIRSETIFTDAMMKELSEIKNRICDMFPVSVNISDIVELPEILWKNASRFRVFMTITLK